MIKNTLLVALLLALAVRAVDLNAVSALVAGNVTLTADSGQLLKICRNCGSTVQDSASIQNAQNATDGTQFFQLEVFGTRVAFKGSNGLYLTRCNGCWPGANFTDSVTASAANATGPALWTAEPLANGKYQFISDIGGYLARCSGCNFSPFSKNFAFVNNVNSSDPVGQWNITFFNSSKSNKTSNLVSGNVTLKIFGSNLRVCKNCGGNYSDSASVQIVSDGTQLWSLEVSGDKVAFKGSNGLYLSVCRNCWPNTTVNPDSAFVNSPNITADTLWIPQLIQLNGKYAFKGSNGRYLTICTGCSPSKNTTSFAFVNSATPETNAQWYVYYQVPNLRPKPYVKIGNDMPKAGYVRLMADNGMFLKSVALNNTLSLDYGDGADYRWELRILGTYILLKLQDTIQFISRYPSSRQAFQDVVIVSPNVISDNTPLFYWTPVKNSNGTWSFQGIQNKKFLARCEKCLPNEVMAIAFQPSQLITQFTIVYV